MTSTIERGDLHEKIACDYLKSHGLKLLATNYHSRFGEIDLIMQEKEVLVFLQKNNKTNHQCRFDVVAISDQQTNWIKSAFDSAV